MEKRLFNIKEAAEYLGISRGSLYKKYWEGQFNFVVKIGRSLRFDKSKMDRFIEENTKEARKY